MATYEYFCDLALDFDDTAGDQDGDGSGAVYTGPGGFQAAIEGWGAATALAAGDTLYLKGTADLSKLVKITVDDDKSGSWVIGDVVQNHNDGGGASGDDWVGELVFIDATTLWVQINDASGNVADVDTADGVDNTTQAETIAGANVTAATAPGIQLDNNQGDLTDGSIKIIGCDASWAARVAQAILDADAAATGSAATNCLLDGDKDYYAWENITFQNAAVANVEAGVNGGLYWIWRQCKFLDATTDGAYSGGNKHTYHLFIQCIFEGNGSNGYGRPGSSTFFACRFNDNTSTGILRPASHAIFIGCVLHNNGGAGVFAYGSRNILIHNVIDGSGSDGIDIGPGGFKAWAMLGNRICNNGGYGIDMYSANDESACEDWNVFHGNNGGGTGLDLKKLVSGRHSYGGGANHVSDPSDDGYDAAGDDFNVVDGKELDSVAIDLNWDTP